MLQIDSISAKTVAKEFTVKAVENGLIERKSKGEDTAKEVIAFFREFYESLCDGNR